MNGRFVPARKLDKICSTSLRAMSKAKSAALRKRTIVIRAQKTTSREESIDERVIAEANDDSAWEKPIDVKRRRQSAMPPIVIKRRST